LANIQWQEAFVKEGGRMKFQDQGEFYEEFSEILESDGIEANVIGVGGAISEWIAIFMDDNGVIGLYDAQVNEYFVLASDKDIEGAAHSLCTKRSWKIYV
jgi:hypothetical protein